jgi:hypothetical protein
MNPAFGALLSEITAAIGQRPIEPPLAAFLSERFPNGGETFGALATLCREGVAEGWLCTRGEAPLRWGRVIKSGGQLGAFSVDVVEMDSVAGPHHAHPRGEIDMIVPLDEAARFDGHGAGWLVYGPGSEHAPTVSGGRALVLYLLPGGEIDFSKS